MTHTVAVYSENGTVYFATNRNSRKVKNIQANPNVAYSTGGYEWKSGKDKAGTDGR